MTAPLMPLRVVVLTALPVEYKAVRSFLIGISQEQHPRGTIYERGKFRTQDCLCDVLLAEIGVGNPGAALEAERAIQYFDPSVALFVGIAGGIKDVQMSDVVAATKIYGYESGRVRATFEARPDIGQSTYPMAQRARSEARGSDWLRLVNNDSSPRAFVGPIAAGEKVIASTKSGIYNFLRSHYSDALAVEMEGRGFLQAAYANPQIDALVVRGIADLLDNKSRVDAQGFQEIAAQNASAFALSVLAKHAASQTDPTQISPAGVSRISQVHWQIVLSGTIDPVDRSRVEAIVEHLKQYLHDPTLTLVKVERGSVVLTLSSLRTTYQGILNLFLNGELKDILGAKIEAIQLIRATPEPERETSALNAVSTKWAPADSKFREDYKETLFVGRTEALTEIERWAKAAAPQKRLLNVKAPPGYGKTWLLKEAERLLALAGLFPLWADATMLSSQHSIAKWVAEAIKQAKAKCSEVRDFDSNVALSQMIRALAEDLCERCYPAQSPIVIVDALDDLSEAQARQLEKLLLEPFWSNNGVRFLVAMRDDRRLYSAVLRGGERLFILSPFSKEDAIRQLQQRAEDADLNTPVPDDLLNIILPYEWVTPGINSFLSKRAANNRQANLPLLSADDLQACRRAVIGPQLDDYHDSYLVKISQLDDTWTEDALAQQHNLSISDAGDIVQKFFGLGIVTRPDRIPNRRKIVEGLRELMQAEHRMRSQ